MTVYVEYAFCDNFTMDFLLLFCATVTLKISFKWWRVALGATVGTVFAMVSVYLTGFLLYLCKGVCLLAMCAVTVGFGKKLFWHILLTFAYTFVVGGAIIGIFNMLNVQYITENGFFYNMSVPLFVYLLGVCVAVVMCYLLVVFVQQNKKIAPHLRKVKLVLDKPYNVLGFCDSGNAVCCNGLPVCFVTKQFNGVTNYFAQQILAGSVQQVQVSTLTGRKTVAAVQAKLVVDGIVHPIYLALPAQKCETQYELLLSGEFAAK